MTDGCSCFLCAGHGTILVDGSLVTDNLLSKIACKL